MFAISSLKLLIQGGYSVNLACIQDSPIEKASRSLFIPRILLKNSRRSISNMLLFINKMKNNKYDLIHSHCSMDLSLIVPALKILGLKTPVVLTKHLGSAVVKKDPFHNFLYKRLNSSIAISEVIRKNLLDTTVLDKSRVTVIHNFIDLNRFKRGSASAGLVREFNIAPSQIVLGVIGRLTPGKGHEDIIEAVRTLSREKPNIKVIVAGAASANEVQYEKSLKEKIANYNLTEYFIFTGFRKDIPELLSVFDIFLFPSRAEAFGLALLEAMASGVASIVNYSEGVKDIALKDVTSLTYGDVPSPSLSEQIRKLIMDKNLRLQLAAKSIERAKQFSPEIFQAKIDLLYNNLINSRPIETYAETAEYSISA